MSTPRRTSVDTATLREMADDAIDWCLSVLQSGNNDPGTRERLARYRKILKRVGPVRSPLRDALEQARQCRWPTCRTASTSGFPGARPDERDRCQAG